ncbi:lipoyl(octanoyl) transferase [Cyclonatronum proteinivorum]|uniref:Octanoyltransferase n=1 Tax=Cyclonatronum proteinivorum TaxID=1457365 RepID=A0A345UGJ9_9BACT|nr:lipoyl(octanoyl) transferase LipB [Cyclonatronum proteinivorum]AXI99600.1 lipoyl(octanoyl) transferase [Cyclonatronum proteinivorum]
MTAIPISDPSPKRTVFFQDLGFRPYAPVWDLQKKLQQELIDRKISREMSVQRNDAALGGYLLFVEHPHVYTLGKSGSPHHLLASPDFLAQIQAEFVPIDRGGDITYHGPGQLVGYPILDLDLFFTDIGRYLRTLEEAVIRLLAGFGIEAGREAGYTGVWVNGAKICAMGLKCSRWVTMHGFALNVNTDLSYFSHIVPCGIADKPVTSMQNLLGHVVDPQQVKHQMRAQISQLFGIRLQDGLPVQV